MPLLEIARIAVVALASGVLVAAAASDVISRRIPNSSVLALAALYAVWAFVGPHASLLNGLLSSLEACAVVFAVSFAFYSLGFVGAGDSKLMTVVTLFVGWAHLVQFVLITSLVGGAIAIANILSRPMQALVRLQTRDFGAVRGVPYGAAIAAGGVLTLMAIMARITWPLK